MRSISEIYDEIVAEKSNQTALAELDSSSPVSVWRLWAMLMATAIWAHELLFEDFKTEVAQMALDAVAGTPRWLREQALVFQLGHSLVYYPESGRYRYALLDETARVVKLAAVEARADGLVILKAAKLSGATPVALSTVELTSLTAYMAKVKFAGQRVAVTSYAADVLVLNYTIKYDALFVLADVQSAVLAAVEAHLARLPFDGRLSITALTDSLQAAAGVREPLFVAASATPAGGSSTSFGVQYYPQSGFFSLPAGVGNFTWEPFFEAENETV